MLVNRIFCLWMMVICLFLIGCTKREELVTLSEQDSVVSDSRDEEQWTDDSRDIFQADIASNEEQLSVKMDEENDSRERIENVESSTIFVHVCGAVNNPNVYELPAGCRVFEAIQAAGGFCEDAYEDYVNQAQVLVDGMKLLIPTIEQVESGVFGEGILAEAEISGAINMDSTGKESNLVNINSADVLTLCTLNGIGETRAKQIVAYREKNGMFQTIEDIKLVEGIKEGTFQKIKDQICVR